MVVVWRREISGGIGGGGDESSKSVSMSTAGLRVLHLTSASQLTHSWEASA